MEALTHLSHCFHWGEDINFLRYLRNSEANSWEIYNISSRFSRNSEAFASEFLENIEEIYTLYYMNLYIVRYPSLKVKRHVSCVGRYELHTKYTLTSISYAWYSWSRGSHIEATIRSVSDNKSLCFICSHSLNSLGWSRFEEVARSAELSIIIWHRRIALRRLSCI